MGITSSKHSFLESSSIMNSSSTIIRSNHIVDALKSDISPFRGYSHLVPVKSDLRINPNSNYLEVSGKIYNRNRSIPLKGVVIEVWHLSPDSKHFKHRARLHTDDSGNYRFITDIPGREMGKNYKIYFKIIYGESTYFTELAFNNSSIYITGRLRQKNNLLQKEKLLPKNNSSFFKSRVNFNISLNSS